MKQILYGRKCLDLIKSETLIDILTATAKRLPTQKAIIYGNNFITYRELDEKSNIIAHHLISLGIKTGDLVGLWMPRGIDLLVFQVGILKSGAGFLPFDVDAPVERIAVCLEDAQAKGIVIHTDWATNIQHLNTQVHTHEKLLTVVKSDEIIKNSKPPSPQDPAYVIYTSGSTGKPKGILISQQNICHFLRSENEILRICANDRVYQGFSIAFDMSFEEIWISYLVGATLFIAPKEISIDPALLTEFLIDNEITVLHAVPTLVSLLTKTIPSLRVMNLGGEACPQSLADKLTQQNLQVFNSYGPTETTVTASIALLESGKKVTIGKPLPNYGMMIMDDQNNLLSNNETGELCVFGPGVAQGYLGLPELTKNKFIQNPYAQNEIEKILYRTGDLAFIDEDDQIHCLGRVDDQVKIRGFRVELGEIEAFLCSQNGIGNAAVILSKNNEMEVLVAYLESDTKTKPDIANLRANLQEVLPPYMVPNIFIWLDIMPRLSSGKIDRKNLKQREIEFSQDGSDGFVPQTPGQELLLENLILLFPGQKFTLESDFFKNLGGHSLLASRLASNLRKNEGCKNFSVQQIYKQSNLGDIANYIDTLLTQKIINVRNKNDKKPLPSWQKRFLCGFFQALSLPIFISFQIFLWAIPFFVFHYMTGDPDDSLFRAISYAILAFIFAHFLIVFIVIALNRLILLNVKPGRYPLWGITYFRWWVSDKLQDIAPSYLLYGSVYYPLYLRAMGCQIGSRLIISSLRVRFTKGLSIGDETSMGSSINIENAYVENSELVLGTCTIGHNSYISDYSLLEGNTQIGDNSYLSGLSSLLENTQIGCNEYWDGSPARKVKDYTPPTRSSLPTTFQKTFEYFFYLFGALGVAIIFFLPIFPVFIFIDSFDKLGFHPHETHNILLTWLQYIILSLPGCALLLLLTVILTAGLRKFFIPLIKPGVYSIHSKEYYSKWLVNLIQEFSLNSLRGIFATVYAPIWFRLLGAKIGKRAEISNAIGIIPETLSLGDETFIADSVVLGSADVHHGWINIQTTSLGHRTFVVNNSYVPNGTKLPENVLIGVQSKPPSENIINSGDTWLGTPSVRLQAREVVTGFPDSLTFNPSVLRFLSRAFIEAIRIILPLAILIASAYSIINFSMPKKLIHEYHHWFFIILKICVSGFAFAILSFLLVCGIKWLIVGRYKPRSAPMWTLFIWCTEAVTNLYETVCIPNFINFLRGTPWIIFIYRLLGCKIGKNVFLDSTTMTEFDCVYIGDGCEINHRAGLQTHLFEDRIMKIDYVIVKAGCTLRSRSTVLYSAIIQDGSKLGPLTLILKGESIPADSMWFGAPAMPWV